MATASQSLNNFSVAGGQDLSPANGTLLMPKLQYRFRVLFFNFGLTDAQELTRQVVDCSRPNVSFAKITLPVYNSTVFMAGKHTWQPLNVNIRDDAAGNVSRAVGEQLQKQLDFIEQASAASASDYKFSTYIDILDGGNGLNEPVILERWELYGCYLESVNYNTLNYGTSEDVRIALTLSYDNAIQSEPYGLESGVGAGAGSFPRGGDGTSTSVGT
jgi:hypothetical protein